jgi:hypothetical protein
VDEQYLTVIKLYESVNWKAIDSTMIWPFLSL